MIELGAFFELFSTNIFSTIEKKYFGLKKFYFWPGTLDRTA